MSITILMKIGTFTFINAKSKTFQFFSTAILSIAIASCSSGGGDSSFKFAESSNGGDESTIKCTVASASPAAGNTKVPATAGRTTTFTVAANTTSCAIKYYLNGAEVTSSGGAYALDPASLTLGTNTLTAKLTNTVSEASVSWNLTKNIAPTCSSQSPSTVNQTMSALSTMSLTASALDGNGDPLTITWKVNGANPAAGIVTPVISAPTASQISFTPDGSLIGSSVVSAVIDDGYDQASCSWNMTVNGDCAITGSSPAVASVRMPQSGTSNQLFQVTTATPGCSVNWTINSLPVSGTTAIKLMTSSQFLTGANVLQASTGVGGPKTWTVIRNSPPTCSQNPTTSPIPTAGVGGSKNFVATASDNEGDTVTASWTINGSPASGSLVIPSVSGNIFTGQLVPDSSIVGSITLAAQLNDGYDTTSCTWPVQVLPACSVSASTPAGATLKIAAAAGTTTSFGVTPNDSNCSVLWTLNGVNVSNTPFLNLASTDSNLNPGSANTLVATLTNGSSPAATRTWTINKNQPPTCSSQTPLATGNSLNVGSNLGFSATAGNPDSDSLAVTWAFNGGSSSLFSGVSSSGNNSSATFTPLAGNVGASQKVRATFNDGYDAGYCEWTVDVGDCSIVSSLPASSTVRMLSPGTSSQLFQLATSTAGCAVTWKINGTTQSGTSATKTFTSSQLLNGGNVITATVGSGASMQTQTWTVVKNTPPTCTQSPAVSPVPTVGQGGTLNLVSTATDIDADTVIATWLINGSAPGAGILAASASGNVFTGVLTPDTTLSGTIAVNAQLNDGYETAACNWPVKVNPACSVGSASPAVSSLKVAANAATTTAFGVVPNDVSCAVTWKLNGVNVGTGSFLSLGSSNPNLNTGGGNTLVATLDNGSSTPVTQTWTLTKNSPPSCGVQTPSSSGNTLNYTNTLNLSSTIINSDADSMTYAWSFNSANSGLFSNISSSSTFTSSRFNPISTSVGTSQKIRSTFSDGYDTGYCEWNVDVIDPSSVVISACLPVTNPTIVTSPTGVNNSVSFAVAATGPGLTYQWKKSGTLISGESSANLAVSSTGASPWSAGSYTLKAIVTDQYLNTAECNWNVKINAAPVIKRTGLPTTDLPIPTTLSKTRINYAQSLPMSITATDANSDTLTYTWTVNGNSSAALMSGSNTTTFAPNSNAGLLGDNTISVVVSDGTETDSQSWTIQANQFSQSCNDLYNGTIASDGGKICTLVGSTGVGDTLYPLNDQSAIRLRPASVLDDGAGNLYVIDANLSTIFFYNRSASNITRFGITTLPGQLRAIIGNGGNGRNSEYQVNTGFKLAVGTAGNNNTAGMAYDSASERLFIADYNNHRVAVIDSTGQAYTILGIFNNTPQNATTNADGIMGNTAICANPSDLKIITYGSYKNLFVACSGTDQIKRVAIDPLDPNYLKAYTVVGQQSSNTVVAGNMDGTMGIAGTARATSPWALASDGDGNLYWTENSGYRVRMVNLSGSSKSFFPNRTTTNSQQITFYAVDNAGALTTGTSAGTTATTGTSPTILSISGPNKINQGSCMPYRVQTLNGTSDAPVASLTAVTVSSALTASPFTAGGSLFNSLANCNSNTGPLTSITVNIASGQSESADFYYKQADTTNRTITASYAGLTSDAMALTTTTGAGAVTKLAVYANTVTMNYLSCSKVMIQAQDASSKPTTAGSNRTINLSSSQSGNFYSDSACTTQIYQTTLPAASSDVTVYYNRAITIPAGYVGSILGNVGQNGVYPTTGVTTSAGRVTFKNPRGLAVNYSGSNVLGFFVSNYDNHSILYINNQGSSVNMGGVAVPAHQASQVIGTGTGGFNADGNSGNITRVNLAAGLNFNSDQSKLWFADTNSARVRFLDISAGTVDTVLGQGLFRYGSLTDSPLPAPSLMLNNPSYLLYDSTNSLMYLADSSNGRIRQINMNSGSVQTLVGKGSGAGAVESEIPTNVLMRNVKGLTFHNSMLLYVDQETACNTGTTGCPAANNNCQLRVYNTTSSSASVLGTSVPAQRVSTVAGDYTNGCGTWNTASTVTATNARLNYPESVVSDGTNVLMSLQYDHCIVKVKPDGTINQFIGACASAASTPTATDGFISSTTFTGAQLSYPSAIVMDPLNSGNFFFADAPFSGVSKIRYVNTKNSAVLLCGGSINVPAVSGGNSAYVQSMINFNPATGSGRINAMAVNAAGTMICWTAGATSDANTGPHTVYCADRTTCTQTRMVGPDSSSPNTIKGGGSLGSELEKVLGTNAVIYAPYGLSFDADGNLYFSDRSNHSVKMIRRWY